MRIISARTLLLLLLLCSLQEHDVAVLELVKPVVFSDQVHAICLPSDKAKTPKAGTNAIVAGWGLTEAYGTRLLYYQFVLSFQSFPFPFLLFF